MFSQKNLGYVLVACALSFQTCSADVLFTYEPIPVQVLDGMLGKSLPNGVNWPVGPEDLSYLTISHWGYDGQVHVGHMIVHKVVAQEVLDIFKEVFDAQFPIERMELIDVYDANDTRSMNANNSSAFCCREKTVIRGTFSNHSYGVAIDINPLVNPCINRRGADKTKWVVDPEAGRQFVDLPTDGVSFVVRTELFKGIVAKGNPCCQAFEKRGWKWGGDCWLDLQVQDFQHFEKDLKSLKEAPYKGF